MKTRELKVISVDFDGTLCTIEYPEIGFRKRIHKLVLWWVKRRQRKGDYIILWTCRTGFHLGNAISWLRYYCDFIPDSVNEDYPPYIAQYPLGTRKIMADLMIDDRQVGLIGWLLRRAR